MKARTRTAAYSGWRQAQEWIGEWLLALEQGRVAVPSGPSIRRALGLTAHAKEREVVARLRAVTREAFPRDGDAAPSLERLLRIRTILATPNEANGKVSPTFLCAFCGESTPLDVDPEDGEAQTFTVDCSVCCRPNVIRLFLNADGSPLSIEALSEQV